ncbi:MAG: response regulator [Candidatus Thiodiazotropha endolucinida]|nr:response regulator [Candidatus Thiodiazotropha taylori]MCG8040387.1 response regulator [Candidatus Thiodiazotropha taylori]MCG8057455.1 response regulator [Candidatus Thiodiazotropha taylori]MCW4242725.1 response regulator [Candidatus Thiodiazotropha taylori]MCW4319288.1 response regulator [Candidatus Thiodiazotropha taylori]
MKSKATTIMLVDDDRLVLASLSPSLQAAGYVVKKATSGKEAIDLCQQTPPDLAVLDMRMPGMDGIEVARWLQQNTQIPFIFLTAYGEDNAIEKAVDSGALGYLIKPVDPPQLLAGVKTALQRSAENRLLLQREGQLTEALNGDRTVNTAVGILIEREHMSEQEAFERLRNQARSNQRRLPDLARELVQAVENINKLSQINTSVSDSQ